MTEERVANLESALASFIEHSERMVAAIHEDIAEIRASNARTDRRMAEFAQQAEKDRQQTEKNREDFNRRWLEIRRQGETDRADFNRRMDEMARQAEKDRQQVEKDRLEREKDRKDFNKRLAGISDSMGTLIEDMVAPCGFQLAKAIFAGEEAQTCTIRLKQRHPFLPGQMMELDLLAIGPTKLLVVEVKRQMDAAKAAEYRDKLRRLPEFFPELASKILCPAVASVYLDASVIAFLNRERLYGIALGDEVMEVVNLGQF